MEINNKKISELHPNINNSRVHGEEQIQQLILSIKEFGFTNPIIIDENNSVLAGHGRLKAAEISGMLEVPTIKLSNLTDAQKRAYIIADNKLGLNAEWDDDLLQRELAELHEQQFDLASLGWNENEINSFLGNSLDNISIDKDYEGAREIEFEEIDTFKHECPRCGFNFND